MKHLSLILTVSVLAATAARAEPFEIACARGEDARKIEVLEPGTVGRACDVRYTRDAGSSVSVPYHADNDAGFCADKARELAGILSGSGFSCTPSNGASLAVAPKSESDDESAGAVAPTEASAPAPAPERPSAAVLQPIPAPASNPEAPSENSETDALAQKLNEVLKEEPPAPAKPVQHAQTEPAASPEPAKPEPTPESAKPAPTPEPEKPQPASQPIAKEPVEKIVGAAPTPAAAPAASAPTTAAPAKTAKPRPVQDVIRATLNAQVAAWNEGDLEGFMDGYWKSDDLRFVSGTEVSKGWSQTLKRYRSRYGDGQSLGQLRFKDLDVQLVRHDVAVVVGRYDLQRADGADSGLFTLVMKRIDGAWRIVHDHTVADPKPAE